MLYGIILTLKINRCFSDDLLLQITKKTAA